MKPNLFEIATRELSQDGFLTWLIRYADPECQGENPAVFECAQKFVRFLMEKQDDFRIEKVRAYRQWNCIDILVEVNDDSVIIIEDKTVTGTHSDQLQRYREKVEEIFGGKTIYCIYLKTGNESVFDLSKNVEAYGYRVVGRGDILEILNSCKTSNDILTEFRENLQTIEDKTKNCTEIESVCSSSYAAEGFFLELAEQLAADPREAFSDCGISGGRRPTETGCIFRLKITLQTDFICIFVWTVGIRTPRLWKADIFAIITEKCPRPLPGSV